MHDLGVLAVDDEGAREANIREQDVKEGVTVAPHGHSQPRQGEGRRGERASERRGAGRGMHMRLGRRSTDPSAGWRSNCLISSSVATRGRALLHRVKRTPDRATKWLENINEGHPTSNEESGEGESARPAQGACGLGPHLCGYTIAHAAGR